MKTKTSAIVAQGRCMSETGTAKELPEISEAQLQQSGAFLRERDFLKNCAVKTKITVRRGEEDVETNLTLDGVLREHDEDGAGQVCGDLVKAVASELGLPLGGRDEVRLRRRLRSALAPSWGRIIAEVERQANDPAKLAKAWKRYGQAKHGGAVSAIRARIADIDPDSIQEVVAQAVAARVNGHPDDGADDHVKMVSRIIDAGGMTEELIVETIHGELVRHVMLM